MAASAVQVWTDRDARLLRIRLARPKANLIDAEMTAALTAACAAAIEARDTRAPRAMLLDAEGPHFSFGASVPEHLPESAAAMLQSLHALVLRLLAFPVPILVAIRGQCLGGGLEIATAGHLLFVAPDAKLGQPEITLGVFAPAASCLLPERIGRAAAEDLLLSGRSISGEEARRLGLASFVADDPEAAALAYFDEHLAKRSAAALAHALAAVRGDLIERVSAKLAAAERRYLTGLMATHDAVEGLRAFIEKRPAQWRDR